MARKYKDVVFPDELDMRALGNSPKHRKENGDFYNWDDYMILAEFRVIWHEGVITVPALFVCDRASIPDRLQGVIQKDGSHQRPSIPHDWVFYNKGVPGCETFDDANALMLAGMEAEGTPIGNRTAIMLAIEGFGQAAWEDNK